MKKRHLINLVIMLSLIVGTFVVAPEAEAGNFFRRIRRVTRFVLNLPYKATRWMGPQLGPIAGTILSQNLMGHQNLGRIFSRAQKVDTTLGRIESVQKQVEMVRKVYGEQASQLRARAQQLSESKSSLEQRLLGEKGYTFADYKRDVIALDELVKAHERAADFMEKKSRNLGPRDVVKLLGRDIFRTALRDLENVVIGELDKELEKFVDPDIILDFLSGKGGGLSSVLEFLVQRELNEALGGNSDVTDEQRVNLLDRIRDSLEQKLKEDADYLKENWNERIREILNQELQKDKDRVGGLDQPATSEDKKEDIALPETEISVDEHGCQSGYVWSPQSGVGCIQEDCPDVEYAHWSYDGYCVCGSSGSIAENVEDPNKECSYDHSFASCPGCIYACVHLDEECPGLPSEQ